MILRCRDFTFPLDRPVVMGIVNVTTDSFSDGGRFLEAKLAIEHGMKLAGEGAGLLDIGGESTRPGATPVALEEELRRVIPVVEALARAGLAVSVDTRKPGVMAAAIDAGCAMVNDVNGFRAEGAVAAVAGRGVGACVMHMQGEPATMQADPQYGDVVAEVAAFLGAKAASLVAAGVARDAVVVDPGFGFGKRREHNVRLFRNLRAIADLGYPVLAGVSRKRLIGEITGREAHERLAGSVAAALMAVQNGASVVRVHDVRETVDAINVWMALKQDGREATR